jgi:hypothetical protein
MIRFLALLWGSIFGAVVVLKLGGIVTASWWFVLAPLYVPALLTIGALVGIYLMLTKQGTPL